MQLSTVMSDLFVCGCVRHETFVQGRFKESLSALQEGLAVDPNNAAQIKEKTDTEGCVRKVDRVVELLAQVRWLR